MKKLFCFSFSLYLLPVFSGSTSVKNMLNMADLDLANKCTWVQAALQEIELADLQNEHVSGSLKSEAYSYASSCGLRY
tara:strand:+ start:688 stop:921 length:234 start_codon:yes stop_codon:yes gene_type:complete